MKRVAMSLIFLLCVAIPALSDELVVNGGFETPVVGDAVCPNQGGWCFTSSANVPGWTVEWLSDGLPGNLEFWRGIGGGPQSGAQNVELDSHGRSPDARVRIYQDLPTCPGATYTSSYYWRPRPSTASTQTLEVRWAGGVIATHGPFTNTAGTTLWMLATSGQGASSTSTRVEFADIGTGDTLGMLLDTVSVDGPDSSKTNGCSTINIKPYSDPNSINLGSGGSVPVIIWGSAGFDVSMIDPFQLSFMSAQVKTVGKTDRALCSILDVGQPDETQFDNINSTPDGYADLTCHFLTQEITGLDDNSTEATVTAVICPDGFNSGCPAGSPTITFSDPVNIVKE